MLYYQRNPNTANRTGHRMPTERRNTGKRLQFLQQAFSEVRKKSLTKPQSCAKIEKSHKRAGTGHRMPTESLASLAFPTKSPLSEIRNGCRLSVPTLPGFGRDVRPSTIERIQTHCNSVTIGEDFNSVGLARGKCVELTKNLSLIQCVRIADEKRGCPASHRRPFVGTIEELLNQRKGWFNHGESVPNGCICHAQWLGYLSARWRVYASSVRKKNTLPGSKIGESPVIVGGVSNHSVALKVRQCNSRL